MTPDSEEVAFMVETEYSFKVIIKSNHDYILK